MSTADATAAITVGSSLRERADLFTRCDSFCTELPVARPGGLPGATIPSDGVVVRWRIRAATRGWVRLRILRPDGAGGYTPVAASEPTQLTGYHGPGHDNRYAFGVSIPVQAGDVLALDRDRSAGAVFHSYGADTSYSAATFSPALGDAAAAGAPVPGRELLLNADLERDADGDGLGDESQDACPAVPASTPNVPCPVTTPPTTTPSPATGGSDGPVVQGEGGPTRPGGSSPTGHDSRPSVRPQPRVPRKRSKRHGAGKPTRADPPNRSEEHTAGHRGGKPTRSDPPARTRQGNRSHGSGTPTRSAPPTTSADRPSGYSGSKPQRPEPTPPKAKRKRRHRGGMPQRADPPPPPKAPTFEPH